MNLLYPKVLYTAAFWFCLTAVVYGIEEPPELYFNAYPEIAMHDGMRAKDINYGVRYIYNKDEQDLIRVRFQGGKLYYSNDQLISTGGVSMVVMDANGHVFLSTGINFLKNSTGFIRHSSLLAGKTVSYAGGILVEKGEVIWFSNASGHYWTPDKANFVFLAQLKKAGVDTEAIKFEHYKSGKRFKGSTVVRESSRLGKICRIATQILGLPDFYYPEPF